MCHAARFVARPDLNPVLAHPGRSVWAPAARSVVVHVVVHTVVHTVVGTVVGTVVAAQNRFTLAYATGPPWTRHPSTGLGQPKSQGLGAAATTAAGVTGLPRLSALGPEEEHPRVQRQQAHPIAPRRVVAAFAAGVDAGSQAPVVAGRRVDAGRGA